MLDFSKFVQKIEDYTQAIQDNQLGIANNKWFNEFANKILQADSDELLRVYKEESIDCATRSALKEMIDFMAIMARNKYSRDKKRINFFAEAATRSEGTKSILANKKVDLSDIIITAPQRK